jgi:hypothetical protein
MTMTMTREWEHAVLGRGRGEVEDPHDVDDSRDKPPRRERLMGWFVRGRREEVGVHADGGEHG